MLAFHHYINLQLNFLSVYVCAFLLLSSTLYIKQRREEKKTTMKYERSTGNMNYEINVETANQSEPTNK